MSFVLAVLIVHVVSQAGSQPISFLARKLQHVHDNQQFRQILDLGGHGQGTVAMMHDHIQDFPTSRPNMWTNHVRHVERVGRMHAR